MRQGTASIRSSSGIPRVTTSKTAITDARISFTSTNGCASNEAGVSPRSARKQSACHHGESHWAVRGTCRWCSDPRYQDAGTRRTLADEDGAGLAVKHDVATLSLARFAVVLRLAALHDMIVALDPGLHVAGGKCQGGGGGGGGDDEQADGRGEGGAEERGRGHSNIPFKHALETACMRILHETGHVLHKSPGHSSCSGAMEQ